MASITRNVAFRSAFSSPLRRALLLSSRQPLQKSARLAAFHSSPRPAAFLSPLPQKVEGTVNDPVPILDFKPTAGSYHWSFERILAISLVPLTAAPFIGGSLSPVLDAVLCSTLLLHSHIGFDACIVDYFPSYRVPGLHRFLQWLLRGATVLAGIGLYTFETNDVGLTAAIGKIWTS